MSSGLDDIEDIISDDEEEEQVEMEPTLQNLLNETELQWIFVGGKGGVGKTTVSSCLAVQLAKVRKNVLIISTDPAHNLSDAFDQKFGKEPSQVKGFDNLFAMEIDPTIQSDFLSGFVPDSGQFKKLFQEVGSSLPGIDEISSFMEIMKQVKSLEFSVVVFDTAPTGHTLRLLSFPTIIEKSLGKFMKLKNMGNVFSQLSSMISSDSTPEDLTGQISQTKELIDVISKQFKNPKATTFVCVCIPEFLSVYETERLVQELAKNEIDVHNIVVNQLVLQRDCPECKICASRMKIQKKYINQIFELYDDFHIVQLPLLGEEVRGTESLKKFGNYLMNPYEHIYKKEGTASLSSSSTTTTTENSSSK